MQSSSYASGSVPPWWRWTIRRFRSFSLTESSPFLTFLKEITLSKSSIDPAFEEVLSWVVFDANVRVGHAGVHGELALEAPSLINELDRLASGKRWFRILQPKNTMRKKATRRWRKMRTNLPRACRRPGLRCRIQIPFVS